MYPKRRNNFFYIEAERGNVDYEREKAFIAELQNRYNRASKITKAGFLDEFTTTTGYNRNYEARILGLNAGKVIGYTSGYWARNILVDQFAYVGFYLFHCFYPPIKFLLL